MPASDGPRGDSWQRRIKQPEGRLVNDRPVTTIPPAVAEAQILHGKAAAHPRLDTDIALALVAPGAGFEG